MTTTTENGIRKIGESVRRKEDDRFIRGRGEYSDDVNKPGQFHAVFVRSQHAHGLIRGIDADAASRLPGVIAVLTGRDYADDGFGPVVHRAIEGDPVDFRTPAFGDGDPVALQINQWPLPADKVSHVGEPVALVVADSPQAAQDAAELVAVDIAPLPAVVSIAQAAAPDAPQVSDQVPGNLSVHQSRGDEDAVARALAASDAVVRGTFDVSRIAGAQMEPRSGIGEYDAEQDRFVITAGNQGVHRYRDMIASALKVDNERVRVICPDVGGGFGPRGHVNPEFVALAWAARRVRRPVKWTNTRIDSFASDWQGRDMVLEGELGIMKDGRISAYRLRILSNTGAHTICYAPQANASRLTTTVYDIETASTELKIYLTNTLPVLPYRAAGRPEVHYALERLVDMAARKIGADRLDCRIRNLIAAERMPFRSAMGLTYADCAFGDALQKVAVLCDWQDFGERRQAARARNRLRGIAISPFVESPVGAPFEMARMRIGTDGRTVIYAGTQNHGQGHESTYAQVVSHLLGISFDDIALAPGDSDDLPIGGGTHSDRSMRMMGTLLHRMSEDIVEQSRPIAARLLQTDEGDLVWHDGKFGIGGDAAGGRTVTIQEIAAALPQFPEFGAPDPAGGGVSLASSAEQRGRINAFPYGAAAAEVEIDPETGEMTLCSFSIVNDCGVAVNPMIVHGQVHGGIVQGVGQTMGEQVTYDPASGQILTGSFLDYMMPRADQFPPFRLGEVEMPTEGNPLGIKAGGEAGTVPALAVIGNAVMDALADRGIDHVDMPFTAARLWAAIRDAN